MTKEGLYERIQEAAAALRDQSDPPPSIGLIPGPFLGGLIGNIDLDASLPFRDVPHYPQISSARIDGKFLFGNIGGKKVVAVEPRFHLYDGYSACDVAFPVRVMKALGADTLLTCDVVCSLNPSFEPARLVMIEDHLNLQLENPLSGPNDERIGPRFPDMSAPYSRRLKELAFRLAGEERIPLRNGVYAAVVELNLVTAAELRFIRSIGADVVGAGTVPEVTAAVHQGMEVMSISVVASPYVSDPGESGRLDNAMGTAEKALPSLGWLITKVIEEL